MKKNSLVYIISFGLLIAVYITKFIADGSYRDLIPSKRNSNSLSKPIAEQISSAQRKVYFFTTAHTLGELGMVYQSCGDYESAIRCYQLAIKRNSQQWIWNYYLGYLYLQQGQSKAAIDIFKKVIELDPQNNFALYYSGEAYREIGAADTAGRILKKIIAAPYPEVVEKTSGRDFYFPLKTYATFQLARIYTNTGMSDSAEVLLKAIIEDQETFGPAYRSLSALYNAKGNLTLANRYSLWANDLADYAPPADSRIDEIALLSRSDQYLLKQIEDAERSDNYHWALRLCDIALRYCPDNKALISIAVFENFRQGFDSKALSYVDKHFEYFRNDAKELLDVTDLLYNGKHLPEALKYFNQVKKLMPQNSTLAEWLFERGKKDEAIAMMSELIRQNPANEKILADEIRLALETGEDESANEYFKMLKKRAPFGKETLWIMGLMAEKKGNLDSAAQAYESAYKADPKDLVFTRMLIDFFIRQKNWKQATGYFKSALDIYPNEPSLLEGFGRVLIACPDTTIKNIPEGIIYSRRALINFKSPYATRLSAGKNLATIYLFLRDKKNATKYINETIKIAGEGKQSEEYIAYFRSLASK